MSIQKDIYIGNKHNLFYLQFSSNLSSVQKQDFVHMNIWILSS